MDYIQGIAAQTENFLFALGFGFLLGVLYDVFRTVRMIISGAAGFILFMDLLYSVICTLLTFCFVLIVDNGRLCVYITGGIVLGWLVYYFSFGTIAMRVSNATVRAFRRIITAFFGLLRLLCKKIREKAE